ncbi:hypothetical protein HRJ34_16265 [Rhizorhabdus wittichii]|uniref:Uncharacterized protein n=1 Tax=Rhizorhabdus wittichii TaxID=160791 RepID=A0A975HC69_9SPHN|nr:hypothetical protein [Rhizorhabdus wittichii]QTH19917.1 hypothetical protein HRJ34_16265 [Rhizorhabdus wittichii]
MRWRPAVLRSAAAGLLLLASAASAAEPREWLMMVKSRNLDPARSAEFDHWYNDIDIPDVLEVPGYGRARRGHAVTGDKPYVALYTISSPDIDKTIIAMLMASWRMDQVGRGTPLIKVTERLYYRRAGKGARDASAAKPTYLYLHRSAGVSAGAMRGVVDAGLAGSAVPYDIYQVLMHDPVTVPKQLVLFELSADSDAAAAETVRRIQQRLGGTGGCGADCETLYRLVRDVEG